MDETRKAYHEENRLSWNEATKAHNSHKRDQAKFFREGGSRLKAEEKAMLGDISGLSILHLQCNSGQDTLSLKSLGAGKVTGVDISDTAIDFARELSKDSGIEGTFIRADIYDWLEEAARGEERWDIVFCSYGAICWLSDLDSWAKGIAAVLKPGGRFGVVEFHPTAWMFDEKYQHKMPYSTHGKVSTWDNGIGDYVGATGDAITPSGWEEGVVDFKNPHPSHEFAWGVSEVISALLDARLTIEHFKEYDYSRGFRPFENMLRVDDCWVLPDDVPGVPIMYSVAARKPLS